MHNCLNCGHESETAFKFCPSCGMEATAGTGADTLVGKVLNGKYRVLEEVGVGSMGRVYKAEHVSLKKPIAIKVLHEDLTVSDETVRRFQGEGIAAGKFSHPSAIQIFDFDKDENDHWFLAMEFVEGMSLSEYLEEKGALSPDGAVNLVIQVLDALAEAHRHDVIHRDLKPDNIMVVGTGSGELLVKVLDFGLSKLVDTQAGSTLMTQTGRILGTPRYMAPEQWQGADVDHRIDIYATGLVLYELVTGASPFKSKTIQDAMVESASDRIPSLMSAELDLQVPEGLEEIVKCALAKDRDDRYANAEEMIRELDGIDFQRVAKTRKRRVSARPRSTATRRRREPAESSGGRPLLLWGGIGVGLAVVVAAVMFFSGPDDTSYVRLSAKPEAQRTEDENKYVSGLTEARDALREGKLDDAMTAVERVRQLPCADSEVYLVRGLVYRAKRDDKMALLDFQEAVKKDANYAEAIAEIGWVQFDRGETAEAEAQFDKAKSLDADNASAKVGQASLFMEKGVGDRAREALAGVDASAASAAVQVRLGQVHLGLDETDAAVAAFTAAKRNNAFDWRAHAGLGAALLKKSEPSEARPALMEAVKLNPDAQSARVSLATLFVSEELWPSALETIDEGLTRNADNGRLQILRGVAMHATGEVDGAITALEAGTSRSPRDHRAWTLLGVLHQQKGDHEQAIACYRKAEDIDTSRVQPFLNHGLCLMAQKKYPEAEPLLQRALQIEKENTFGLFSYGVLQMDYLGDKAKALQAFQGYRSAGGADKRVDGWIQRLSGK